MTTTRDRTKGTAMLNPDEIKAEADVCLTETEGLRRSVNSLRNNVYDTADCVEELELALAFAAETLGTTMPDVVQRSQSLPDIRKNALQLYIGVYRKEQQ